MRLFSIPPPTLLAGFLAVLIGYASSAAIIWQAAIVAGATTAQISGWMTALGLAGAKWGRGWSERSTAWETGDRAEFELWIYPEDETGGFCLAADFHFPRQRTEITWTEPCGCLQASDFCLLSADVCSCTPALSFFVPAAGRFKNFVRKTRAGS